MKSNNQQCKKPLIRKCEENNKIADELTEESSIFESTTQSFSEICELDSKQIEIKLCDYNKSEQVFNQKQQDNYIQKGKAFYENLQDYIQQFKPKDVELDTKLKPFIPDYIPALNQIENGLSIPRPDGQFDDYGIYDVREVLFRNNIETNQIQKEPKKEIIDEFKNPIKKQKQQKEIHQQTLQRDEEKYGNFTELLKIISLYQPKRIIIEAPLKPFIPDYIPSDLNPDPMLKVSRPDGKEECLGLTVLDERKVKGVYMQCN